MSETKPDWPPCFADSYRGIAFFDGITIETDKIEDPRYDRVLSIMKEEQVLMCRQMARKLTTLNHSKNRPLLALDVGTGSGVFAIYSAKHCNCKVLALDISPRALRFARNNAIENQIHIYETR
jgi:methylase of polypeptide subunit release factors